MAMGMVMVVRLKNKKLMAMDMVVKLKRKRQVILTVMATLTD